tara:strand:- start:30 stop:191 length:162 start_codon:yes stop_codon:yes gene_type:complete
VADQQVQVELAVVEQVQVVEQQLQELLILVAVAVDLEIAHLLKQVDQVDQESL